MGCDYDKIFGKEQGKRFKQYLKQPEALKMQKDMQNIKFHGSPAHLEKLSLDPTGSSGGTAQGFGIYLADRMAVAEHYRRSQLHEKKNIQSRISALKQQLRQPRMSQQQYQDIQRKLQKANRDLKNFQSTSSIYQVNLIPNEDTFLLWDKPLTEQTPYVKSRLNELFNMVYDEPLDRMGVITGEDLYRDLTTHTGSQEQASAVLKRNGIHGNKYLDQQSRGKGSGSYNYVVFDDRDVEITSQQREE